ncbi:putative spermidine/putrescine transport system permease protein [Natronorubrum thiooxidans]|uniref:Putative spermidine/putrescine transport system permease protein n=1 Tax=Natronorubrum thiooxidans TaxID=308853 RepID=A0A1N7GXF8_9EURY|nr:ABC transporter permease [Natronorubrum thiooxidans]SIS17283.1 putative spermidine/putrescine transport system permease protein [Natronorubrum thiooxidans]
MATKHTAVDTQVDQSALTRLIQRFDMKRLLAAYFILISLYIYAPMIALIVFSFNAGGISPPYQGFTLAWYSELVSNQGIINSVLRSIQLALVVTVITTILGTAAALAYRFDFRGRKLFLYLIVLGIITPGIAFSVGSTLFLNEVLGFSRSMWLALPAHVVWTLPFAVIVLLAGFPPNLAQNEEAARVMGADRRTTFREIVLPQIAPTVLGAAVFAFTLSYNEAERGLLLVGRDRTMPMEVFSIASAERATPELFALGSVTTVFSTILLLVAGGLVVYGARQS